MRGGGQDWIMDKKKKTGGKTGELGSRLVTSWKRADAHFLASTTTRWFCKMRGNGTEGTADPEHLLRGSKVISK